MWKLTMGIKIMEVGHGFNMDRFDEEFEKFSCLRLIWREIMTKVKILRLTLIEFDFFFTIIFFIIHFDFLIID